MKLLAVISHKGGAGKTTSAVMLAEELAERGYRVLLVDADRQHSAGLLLDIPSTEDGVQETRVSNLDYLASGRLTELEVEGRSAEIAGSYDVGVVDTPSLDDALARAWLSESDAAVVVLQVEPLTMKTMHGAMATIETVRRVNPRIQVLGLLPTMYDESQETHRTLLSELVNRRRDSVFPAIPHDSGLMHRAGMSWAAEVGAAARDAYWSATDRIVAGLLATTPEVETADCGSRIADCGLGDTQSRAWETEPATPQSAIRHPQSEAPRRDWGRILTPLGVGVAAALLVLALLLGPLRTRLLGGPAPAYAVPPAGQQAPGGQTQAPAATFQGALPGGAAQPGGAQPPAGNQAPASGAAAEQEVKGQ